MDGLMAILEDATGLPPAQLAAYMLGALLVWTALVKVLRFGAPRFAAWARTTPSLADDEFARRLVWISDVLDAGTMALWRWLPRLAWGRQPYDPGPSSPATRRRPRRPPPVPVLVLALAAVLGALSAGCGATARDVARQTVLTAASAVEAVDRVEADAYGEASRRALAAVEARIAAGELERGDEALAAYREIMAPHDGVESGLRGARSAVLGAESAVDAWGAGEGEHWLRMGACMLVGLVRLAELLEVAELPIPEQLTDGLGVLGTFAELACDGGGGA